MGTLAPDKASSVDWDTTENLYLEGDNLEILKLLQKSYTGKVKMIYIDPPYNTGKDFVYPDKYGEGLKTYLEYTGQIDGEGKKLTTNTETDGRYHSKWLNMMYPRLMLARNLLKDDGVIFVSIDDHEVHNLRKIMDEVFSAENYLNDFCWVNNLKGRQISGFGAAKTHEYILCYAKSAPASSLFEGNIAQLKSLMPSTYKGFDYEVESDEGGEFVIKNELHNTNSAFNEETRPSLVFNIHYHPETRELRITDVDSKETFPGYIKIEPKKNNNGVHKYHAWRWSRGKVIKDQAGLKFVAKDDGCRIYTKVRDHETTSIKDLLTDISTTSGTKELLKLFDGKKLFDFPKPVDLLKVLVSQTRFDDVILDFFSGSDTTAHAVMAINAEDGENRRFILSQLQEPTPEDSEARKAGYTNIAEIGNERIRRAGTKIRTEYAEKIVKREAPLDTGFKTYRLTPSTFNVWDVKSEDDIQQKLVESTSLIKGGAKEEDVLTELILKSGYGLTEKVEQITMGGKKLFSVAGGQLIISLESGLTLDHVRQIAEKKPAQFVAREHGFASDDVLTNTAQIMKDKGIDFRVL